MTVLRGFGETVYGSGIGEGGEVGCRDKREKCRFGG